MSKLHELKEKVEEWTRGLFDKEGTLNNPTWFVEDIYDSMKIVVTPLENEFSTQIVAFAMKRFFADHDICRYVFVSESWASEGNSNTPTPEDDLPPSQHPRRKEVLLFTGEDNVTDEKLFMTLLIDRNGSKPRLTEVTADYNDNIEGILTNLFEKKITKH